MSLIYLIFMNKTSSFQTTPVTEESLRDYHNLITTFFQMSLSSFKYENKYYLFTT